MKKNFFSRVTAVLLTLIMVLTLIPMSSLGVFAEAATLTEDNLDDAEIVIMNEADWNVVANADKDFADQTIKLGADITFTEAAPVLFKHADGFKGTFYGCGKTVSGTALTGLNLIAVKVVSGGIIDGSDGTENNKLSMTITGFTCNVTSAKVAFASGALSGTAKVSNIKVSDCSISSTTSQGAFIVGDVINDNSYTNGKDVTDDDTFASICATVSNCIVENCEGSFKSQSGMIVASTSTKGCVLITDCKVTGNSVLEAHTQAAVGMMIGKMNDNTNVKIVRCQTDSTAKVIAKGVGKDFAVGAGMFVGNANAFVQTKYGMLRIYDSVVSGTVISDTTAAGGVVGSIMVNKTSVIDNCDVDVTVTSSDSNGYVGGVIGAFYPSKSASTSLTISDCDVNITIPASSDTVSATKSIAGGIIGNYVGTSTAGKGGILNINDCNVETDFTVTDGNVSGGIVGASTLGAVDALNVSGCNVTAAINTNKLSGGVVGQFTGSGDSCMNISECDVAVNITTNNVASGGVVGQVTGSGSSTLRVSNCDVATDITTSNAATGGVLGTTFMTDTASFTVSSCKVTGKINETSTGGGSPALGGILGIGNAASEAAAAAATGTNTIEKCHINMEITAGASSKKIGGIIGKWGYSTWDSANSKTNYYVMPVTLNVTDCLVEGNYGANRTGGVMFEYVAKNSKLNVSNVIVTATVAKVWINTLNDSIKNTMTSNVCENNYTTISGTTTAGFTVIPNTDEFIDGLIKFENETTDDKIVEIRDHYNCNLVQVTTDGTFAIRFISSTAIELKDTDVLEMSVSATLDGVTKTFESSNSAEFGPFESLKAYGDTQTVNASEYGAKQFFAIIIKGIPMEDASTLEFTITLTLNGTQVDTCTGTIPAAAFAA